MAKAIFYHAGCPVCVSAEKDILDLIPETQIEVIHLGTDKIKVKDADGIEKTVEVKITQIVEPISLIKYNI